MTDIVERLRFFDPITCPICREAADELDRLRHDIERYVAIAAEQATKIERLRAALHDCSQALANINGSDDYYVRQARAALAKEQK